jgi:hypothetical protein
MLQSDPREIPKSLKSNNQKSRPHMETTTTTTTKKSSNEGKERQKKREELGGFWRSRKRRGEKREGESGSRGSTNSSSVAVRRAPASYLYPNLLSF